jgi:hypothetical protein
VKRSKNIDLDCFNRVILVMDRACRSGVVKNPIDFIKERFRLVVAYKLKMRMP